jgi:hypothetical protein
LAIFALIVATGQRGGEEFFDNLWLTGPFLAAYVAGVAAFILGALAIAVNADRGIAVLASTLVGLVVTSFGVLEVVFPH